MTLHLGATPWRGGDDDLLDQARRLEALDYDSFWLPESHFVERSARPQPLLELAAVAAVTERLRLGTTSFLLPIRHPLLVAEEIAVLDRLAGGRLILGLGRGFREELLRAFDLDGDEKRRRFERAVDLLKRAWSGATIETGDGRGVRVWPLPIQQPHPPLWVAAFGPRALEQAGALALPYLASPIESLDRLEQNYRRHRRAWQGDPAQSRAIVPVMRTVFVGDDDAEVAAARRRLERERERLAVAMPSSLRASPPVDDWALVGDADQVRAHLERYRSALGLTHLIVRSLPGLEPERAERSLASLRRLTTQLPG